MKVLFGQDRDVQSARKRFGGLTTFQFYPGYSGYVVNVVIVKTRYHGNIP
jgi:hypothetical protein